MNHRSSVRRWWIGPVVLLHVLSVGVPRASAIDWDGSTNNDFNTGTNWAGNLVPNDTQLASIGLTDSVSTSSFSRVEDLALSNGALLSLGSGAHLVVDDRTTLNKTTAAAVQLFVNDTSAGATIDFDTNFLDLINGGELDMQGGFAQVDRVLINSLGQITGNGTVEFTGVTVGDRFDNNGALIVDGGLLTLRRTTGSIVLMDPDGTGDDGSITVTNTDSDLVVDLPLSGSYSTTLTIGDGNSVSFNSGWTLSSLGTLNMTGGALGPAILAGTHSDINGDLNATGISEVATTADFGVTAAVSIAAGGTLELQADSTLNGGSYSGLGQLSTDGTMSIVNNVTFNMGALNMDGQLGTGNIEIGPDVALTVNSTITDAHNGELRIASTSQAEFNGGASWALGGAGLIYLEGPSAILRGTADLITNLNSRVEGGGTINVDVTGGGFLAPGDLGTPLQTIAINGNLTQQNSGVVEINLGGNGMNSVVDVSGTATLAGTLDVNYLGPFPNRGYTFRVLDYGARVGTFQAYSDFVFAAGSGDFLVPIYTADHLTLYCPLIGDANFDGVVSGADFTNWADNFGTGTLWEDGDFNGDDAVTGADFTLWADNFGMSVAFDAESSSVPEPTSIAMVVVAGLAGSGFTRRRRKYRFDRLCKRHGRGNSSGWPVI